uniref:Putative secreted protein n=1 Tax=Ixodes ricinus TaxID=34613 RepID=A0A6B0UCL0_IXORI
MVSSALRSNVCTCLAPASASWRAAAHSLHSSQSRATSAQRRLAVSLCGWRSAARVRPSCWMRRTRSSLACRVVRNASNFCCRISTRSRSLP